MGGKDSLRNAEATGEFVWNIATRPLAEKMNATSMPAPHGTNEFDLAGLTQAPSRLVAPPRVQESPVNFECKVTQIVRLQDQRAAPIDAWLVIGEVVGAHIRQDLLKDGIFDTFGAEIILRAGGPTAYVHVTPDSRFDMTRPA